MSIRIDGTNTTANPGITGGDADTGLQFGTDEVSIVTGGTNRITASTDIVFNNSSGTERIRMQSGGGISFNGDTAAANALDDYEEGTFTPSFLGAGGVTYGDQLGQYTKIGNLVIAKVFITISALASPTGYCNITLPFAAASSNVQYGSCPCLADNLTGDYRQILIQPNNGSASAGVITECGTTSQHLSLATNQLTTLSDIRATIIYQVS